jgi:hypothetical protein
LVHDQVGDLARVRNVIGSASFLDRRYIARGTTHEIAIDAETMRGEIAFYAVPRLEAASINEQGPAEGADVLSLVMAGAHASTMETTVVAPVVRKAFVWSDLRVCA